MGTTTQKLEYLGTTKSQLKDQINYGLPSEEQITSSTTFRKYVGSIFEAFLEALRNPDTLFTNLPKTSGSGSQITLNGTANAPMRITLNPTAISQDGTPTPSSPQDIHTISGNNSVVVEGKNIFNGFRDLDSQTYIDGVLTIAGWKVPKSNYYRAIPNQSYTFSFVSTQNNTRWYLQELDENYTELYSTSKYGSVNQTFTLHSETKYFSILFNLGNPSSINYPVAISSIQLEKGSTTTDYEPHQEQTKPINLNGKNLCNSTGFKNGYLDTSGVFHSENQSYILNQYISVKGGTTYTYSSNQSLTNMSVFSYDSTKTFIKRETIKYSVSSATITIDSNAKYVVLGGNYNNSTTISQIILDGLDLMFELGDTATEYVKYVEPIELGTIEDSKNEFVRSDGETNLFDKTTITSITQGSISNDIITSNNFSSASWQGVTIYFASNPISITNEFTISLDLRLTSGSTGNINKINDGVTDFTMVTKPTISSSWQRYVYKYTPSSSYSITRIYIQMSAINGQFECKDIQINLGTTALPYTPYEKGWYYKQGIGKVVLDGTQNITSCNVSSGNSDMAYAYTTLLDDYIGSSDGVCDKLTKSNVELKSATNSNNEMFSLSASTWGGLRFYFDKTRLSEVSVAGFKTWLSNNNITICYALKTPTYTKITGELAQELEEIYKGMLSYDGTTNISQVNNDLPFELMGSAIQKL